LVATIAIKKRRMLTSVYEAPWKTIQTEHNTRFQKAEVLFMRMQTSPAVSAFGR